MASIVHGIVERHIEKEWPIIRHEQRKTPGEEGLKPLCFVHSLIRNAGDQILPCSI